MDYFQIVKRAMAISWRHKYLWLLALFAGEATTVSLSFQTSSVRTSQPNNVSYSVTWNQFTDWASAHAALLWTAGITLAMLCVVLFVVSAVANGALVKGSAELDAGHAFGLGQAWSAGVRTFWPVLGLKFFALIVGASAAIVIGGLGLMAVVSASTGAVAAAVASGVVALILLLAAIPFFLVFGVAIVLGVRAIVLDGTGAADGLGSALKLIRRRLGRVAIFWVIVAAAGIIASIVVGVALAVAAVPIVVLSFAAYYAGGWLLAFATGVGLGVAWLIVVVTFAGGVNAFTSTCWTVAYPRFDVQPQPAVSAQPQPA